MNMVEKEATSGSYRFGRMLWAHIGAPLLASAMLFAASIVLLRITVPFARAHLELHGGWILRAFQMGAFVPPIIFAFFLCRQVAAAGTRMTEDKRHWIALFISVNWAFVGMFSPVYFFFHGLLTPDGLIDHVGTHWTAALVAYEMNMIIMRRAAAVEKSEFASHRLLHLDRVLRILFFLVLVRILHTAGDVSLSAAPTSLQLVLLGIVFAAAAYAQWTNVRVRQSTLAERIDRGTAARGNGHSVSVLVVEDSPAYLAMLRAILETQGCRVHVAESGAQGLMQAGLHDLDLILLDVALPDIDGRVVARRMRDAGIHVPIVAVTALAGSDLEKSCLDAGITSMLPKPVDARTMSSVLTSHCGFLAAHEDQSRKTHL